MIRDKASIQMRAFLKAQKKKIEIDKWCEGHRLNYDPGQQYVLNWIAANAGWFRKAWEQSLCKTCCHAGKCGYLVLQECEDYHKTTKSH